MKISHKPYLTENKLHHVYLHVFTTLMASVKRKHNMRRIRLSKSPLGNLSYQLS